MGQSLKNIDLKQQNKHLIILHGSTLQYSGPNNFIQNNVKMWKKLGYKITLICQDRDIKAKEFVDYYVQGQFLKSQPLLEHGQVRVIIPDINGLVPILAQHKACNFPGIQCKTVQQMTDQQIETNINKTVQCLKTVIKHDKPFKVIANNVLLSGIIAQRGLYNTSIPYDITVPGPAIRYTLMPYPHIWKWFLTSFKNADSIFHRCSFVKRLFLKIFKNYISQCKLLEKSKISGAGIYSDRFIIQQSYVQLEKQFLQNVKNIKLNPKNEQIKQKLCMLQTHNLFHAHPQNNRQKWYRKGSFLQTDLLSNWISYSQQDQTILFVGALINKMGVGQLLAIAPYLISERPTVKFIFSGVGPCKEFMMQLLQAFQTGNLQRAKRIAQNDEFITQLDIEKYFFKADRWITERIIFTDLLDEQTMCQLMPLCHIFISPGKLLQQYNLSLLEALCFGLTPICNDHSWNTEILDAIQKQIPSLAKIIRFQRQKFFELMPIKIIQTLNYIKNVKFTVRQYRERIRHIVTNNFSWEHSATVMAELL